MTEIERFSIFSFKALMSHPKLLKAPARRLLLTFVMTAGMAVVANASSPQVSLRPVHGPRHAVTIRARTREQADYSQIEGVLRWGINE